MIQNIQSDSYDLRQSSAFGLGLLAQKMSFEEFKNFFPKIMEILEIEITNKKEESDKIIHYNSYFDNVISAYGKCFEAVWDHSTPDEKQHRINNWIVHLPLKSDMKEGKLMNELLLKLLNSQDN